MIIQRTLTQADFDQFAQLSGDDNPIHVDPDFSARTRFGRTVSHGMLLFTVIRGLLEQLLPSHRLLDQNLMFPAPCYADEPLSCVAEVQDSRADLAIVNVSIKQIRDGKIVLEGQSWMARPGAS